jgi:hypothetical protein
LKRLCVGICMEDRDMKGQDTIGGTKCGLLFKMLRYRSSLYFTILMFV